MRVSRVGMPSGVSCEKGKSSGSTYERRRDRVQLALEKPERDLKAAATLEWR